MSTARADGEQWPTPPPLRTAAVTRALAGRRAGAEAEVAGILAAAYRLISRDGVIEPGVRELVAEAGLANRSFYRHFATKDDFLLVMIEDVQGQLTSSVEARMAQAGEPVDRVRAWVLGVLDQAADQDAARLGRPFLVHGPRLREAYPAVFRATGAVLLDRLETAIRDSVSAGQLHCQDPRADARAILHLTMSVMQSHVLDRTQPSPDDRAGLVNFALRAMK